MSKYYFNYDIVHYVILVLLLDDICQEKPGLLVLTRFMEYTILM